MAGSTKLMTASGGGVVITPASSIASDVTVNVPSVNDTLVGLAATQTLTNKTLTNPNFDSAQVATVSGTAPLYMCRAWVNFNGTGTVAIRASGNVSSITDVATGRYTVNFATAMPDANYSIGGFSGGAAVGTDISVPQFDGVTNTYTASAISIRLLDEESSTNDAEYVTINVFR